MFSFFFTKKKSDQIMSFPAKTFISFM